MRYLPLLCWLWPLFATAQSPVPAFDEAPFVRAEAAFRDERYEQAIPIYDSLLKVLPPGTDRYVVAATRLGRCHIDLGDYPKALVPLRRAAGSTAVSPTLRADALLELGFALWLKGRPDSLLICTKHAAALLPVVAHPSLLVRRLYYQATGHREVEEGPEALALLREAEQLIRQYPNDITVYDQARVFRLLTSVYAAYGWEKSRKNTLHQLKKAMAALPKQEVHWGHIVLEGHGLFEYAVGDSLTFRLEQVYSRRLGLGSIGRAYAMVSRLFYTALPDDKLNILDKATAAAKIHFGEQSHNVTTYMATRTWPLYNNNYVDSAITNENKVYQRRLRQGGYIRGARAVMLMNLEALHRLKGDMVKSNAYLDSMVLFVQERYPDNSIEKASAYPVIINNKLKNDDLSSSLLYLDTYKRLLTISVTDTSTLMIGYYTLLDDYYDKLGNNEAKQQALLKADSLIIDAFGTDSDRRIDVLFGLGDIYLRTRQLENHNRIRAEERRLLLLNRKNSSDWTTHYKYNIGYSFLVAILQYKYEEADALLIQFEQAIPADDPDYATHLSECASLASLANNQNARTRFLEQANERMNQDKQKGQYNLSTHLSITDQLVEEYLGRGACDSAAHYMKISFELSSKNSSPNDPDILIKFAHKELELCQCRGCDIKTMIELHEKEIGLREQFKKINVYLYGQLASLYREIGAYDRASVYEAKMLDLLRSYWETNKLSPKDEVEYLMESGRYSLDTSYIIACYSRADSISSKHKLPAAWIHGRLLKHYNDEGLYQQAIDWGNKLPVDYSSERMGRSDSINQVIHYTNLGMAYWLNGNPAESNKFYQLALDLIQKIKCNPNTEASVLESLSYWRRTQGDFQEAVDFAQKGLRLLGITSFDEAKVSTQSALTRDLYHRISRAYGMWYDATGVVAYNDSAYLYATYALRTLNAQSEFAYLVDPNALQNRHTSYVKFTFEEHFKALSIRNGITRSTKELHEAFNINEQWRAPAFRQTMQDRRAEKKSVLARKMRENTLAIDKNQALKFQAEQAGRPLNYYSDVVTKLNELYKEQEGLSKEYARTQNFNDQNNVATIKQLQTQLRKEQRTYVSYFLTDSMLMTFVVCPDTFLMTYRKGDMAPLRTSAVQLRQELRAGNFNPNKLSQSAIILYDTLLRPIERWLSKDLVIVPDDILAGLPFEVFFTERLSLASTPHIKMKDWPLVMNKYSIVYAQSATVWLEMLQRKTKPSTGLLAMAPSYAGLSDDPAVRYWRFEPGPAGTRASFDPLKYTRQEIEDVAGAISKPNPRMYKGPDAKSKVFFQEASLARIIHLAIHAKGFESLGDYSYLVFAYPDSIHKVRVFARDVASMRLNADMVVLSGCETGQGSNYTGEGVVGLGRAFSVAGAKSVVLSLWNVDDQSTSTLMKQYYTNLKAGQSKDKAMNNARRTLINQGYAPYFWAPFVVYGDARVVQF